MSGRTQITLYLIAVHLPFALAAALLLETDLVPRAALFALEAVFAISVAGGLVLVKRSFAQLDLLRSGAELLGESDFGSRLTRVGPSELDDVVALYNRMFDRLQDERLQLEEQHVLLDKLLRAAPWGVMMLDLDGRIASLNPAAEDVLGRAPELIGKPPGALDPPLGAALRELIAAPPAAASTVVALLGSRRIKIQRSELFDRGFPRSFFVLEELTEELRRSERAAYEKLIRMMSHEVNNSVAAVGSLLESCLAYRGQIGADDRADYEQALRVAIGRTAQLGHFMRSLAEVVKIPPPRLSSTDVNALAADAVTLVRPDAAAHGIEIHLAADAALPPIALDRSQIEQVLVNILRNAIEAIAEPGPGPGPDPGPDRSPARIDVSTSAHGRGSLIVENSGPRIPEAVKQRLFTPFFTTKPNGQGLGLTLVQEVLTNHRFRFALESDPEPTRFTIRF
ncbi:MAG TPA: ATP-binding protein [Kofleriaceae bacterium]|nr:ATP-binding protein [Kofleriaceae bacterium]